MGKINVICEGYDYPDDPYILRGSCGVSWDVYDVYEVTMSVVQRIQA